MEEVAVLDVCTPLGIRKQISPMAFTAKKNYYYSGKFSLMPGKQTVALSYIGASGTAYYSSQSVEISFYAEKGRLYRTFYVGNLYLHLETKNCEDLHRFHVKILDVTDREALSKIANSGRFEAFRREARAMLQQLDGNPGADASAK